MSKKKTPFLDFYKRCIETGSIKGEVDPKTGLPGGLCSTKLNKKLISLFEPGEDLRWDYWAYTGGRVTLPVILDVGIDAVVFTFTPMRQTVVLFCAAINNEL